MCCFFFFSSRRRHTRCSRDWSSDVCSSDLERNRLGLNDPIFVQYGTWLKDAVRGDLGTSSRTNEEVSSMIRRSMGNTLQLIVWGVLISATLAIAIGVFSAIRQYSIPDYLFTGLSYVGIAMPPFWFGLIAIEVFGVQL